MTDESYATMLIKMLNKFINSIFDYLYNNFRIIKLQTCRSLKSVRKIDKYNIKLVATVKNMLLDMI